MDKKKLNSSSGSSQHMEPAEVKECTDDHNEGSGSQSHRKKLNTPPQPHKTRGGVNYTVPKPFSLSAEKPSASSSSVCARAGGVDSHNNNNNSPGNAVSRNSSSGSRSSQVRKKT